MTSSSTLIIASGAYLDPELEAEFGRIPPAFLPAGNRRLFERQCRVAGYHADKIILTVPDNYVVSNIDLDLLMNIGAEIVGVPPGLSLGESLVYTINVSASSAGSVYVLHGDTLLEGYDFEISDRISVADAPPEYRWGDVSVRDGYLVDVSTGSVDSSSAGRTVLSGYFAFSDGRLLIREITRSGGDFLRGLVGYSAAKPLLCEKAETWLDFGHVRTYFRSRRKLPTHREFNALAFERHSVIKTGRDAKKIAGEAQWYETLPLSLRAYVPAFLGRINDRGKVGYAVEYVPSPTLSELYVFGCLDTWAWSRMFNACAEFLDECLAVPVPVVVENLNSIYADKTFMRLEAFSRASGVSLTEGWKLNGVSIPSLTQIVECVSAEIGGKAVSSFIHGDFCFSNILYDARADRIRVIDPRGLDGFGSFNAFGDIRYDIAKLFHSVVGQYDFIISDFFRIIRPSSLQLDFSVPTDWRIAEIQREFISTRYAGLTVKEADSLGICILLFLSMIPLHGEDQKRQFGFLANAMRLFLMFDGCKPGETR